MQELPLHNVFKYGGWENSPMNLKFYIFCVKSALQRAIKYLLSTYQELKTIIL